MNFRAFTQKINEASENEENTFGLVFIVEIVESCVAVRVVLHRRLGHLVKSLLDCQQLTA